MARRRFKRSARAVVDVRGLGFDGLQDRLNQLKNTVGKRAVARAMKQSMTKIIKPAAKANIVAASTGPYNTNTLKKLPMRVITGRNRKRRPVTFRSGVVTPDRLKLALQGDELYYPAFLEVGTVHIRPQRMLRRTRDTKASILKSVLGVKIGDNIERMVKRLGRKKAIR